MSTTYIPVALRKLAYERAKGCCEYCLIADIASFAPHEAIALQYLNTILQYCCTATNLKSNICVINSALAE